MIFNPYLENTGQYFYSCTNYSFLILPDAIGTTNIRNNIQNELINFNGKIVGRPTVWVQTKGRRISWMLLETESLTCRS